MTVTHSFVSSVADGPDSSLLRPSDWNASHTIAAWEDLRVEPIARTTGNFTPVFEQYLTDGAGSRGVYAYSFDDALVTAQKELHYNVQMPHAWNGGIIKPHLHWIPNTAATGQTIRWGFEYSWADVGAVFGNTTIVYNETNVQGDANLVAKKHYKTSFGEITPTTSQDNISSVMMCRVWRDSAHANDTYSGAKAGVLYLDIHYQLDAVGSATETSK